MLTSSLPFETENIPLAIIFGLIYVAKMPFFFILVPLTVQNDDFDCFAHKFHKNLHGVMLMIKLEFAVRGDTKPGNLIGISAAPVPFKLSNWRITWLHALGDMS